jgi:Fe2+ transport system protein B
MKYVLANANKGDTDRLAQRDIDDAAKSTAIMTYLKYPRTVSNNYKQIESTFNKKLGENIALLKSSGVTDQWILQNAGDVPGIKKIYEEAALKNKQRQTRQNIADQPQAQTNILKTIPIR